MMLKVPYGQDPYNVIGQYIRNHITAIEDMIAVIQVNEVIMNELYMVDMNADGYFYWKSDWWEGEEKVALLDYFPVSEAERMGWIPCSERLPEPDERVLVYTVANEYHVWDAMPHRGEGYEWEDEEGLYHSLYEVAMWLPLPQPYAERRQNG